MPRGGARDVPGSPIVKRVLHGWARMVGGVMVNHAFSKRPYTGIGVNHSPSKKSPIGVIVSNVSSKLTVYKVINHASSNGALYGGCSKL